MKIIVILVAVSSFVSCASKQISEFKPNPIRGCVESKTVKERLDCIGRMLQTMQDEKNSKIETTEEIVGRLSEKEVAVVYTHCLVNLKTKEVYNCIDHQTTKYDPTFLGLVMEWGLAIGAFGIGYIVGGI